MQAFNDLALSQEANDTAAEFVRERIAGLVKDPSKAAILSPRGYPIGTKRICLDTRYYETFNRNDVDLVDLRADPIEAITPRGVRTRSGERAFDALVLATGFDAMTGALLAIDLTGRNGERLADKWEAGPRKPSRPDASGISEPVHDHGTRKPLGALERDRLDRAARRVDR